MYATCLFCHAGLGTNEVIEHFPVGRRLAFDAAKGRLWVVCRKCERWNLTPLEERWEAIEECERLFSGTRLRVSTGNIGLAKLRDGLELVRIGSALRPEMAAWRYGDQLGRRRIRHIAVSAAGIAALAGIVLLGPATGAIAGGSTWGVWNAGKVLHDVYQRRRSRLKLVLPDDDRVVSLRKKHLQHVGLIRDAEDWALSLSFDPGVRGGKGFIEREYRGPVALRLAGQVLPRINESGATRPQVQEAVKMLDGHGDPMRFFRHQARSLTRRAPDAHGHLTRAAYIANFPLEARLALEMAAHEEQERRAMEGELALLEAAWRQAEEVAKIADEMFLPAAATDRLDALKSGG